MNKPIRIGFALAFLSFIVLGCDSKPAITTLSATSVKLPAPSANSPLASPLSTPDLSALSSLSGSVVFERGDDTSAHLEVFDWHRNQPVPLNTASAEAREPAWSPDAKQIVFTAKPSTDRFELHVINRDGSNEKTLVSDPSNNWYPSWSPDGSHLAFVSDRSGQIQVFVGDANGQNARQLTSAGNNWAPSWSPDGSTLVFVSDRDHNRELYTIRLDGSGERRLTNTPTDEDRPAWSPDGKQIAFMRFVEQTFLFDSSEVFVMNADGSAEQRLTSNQAGDSSPHWSPDGKWLIFSSDRSGSWSLYVLRISDNSVLPLSWSALGRSANWAEK